MAFEEEFGGEISDEEAQKSPPSGKRLSICTGILRGNLRHCSQLLFKKPVSHWQIRAFVFDGG